MNKVRIVLPKAETGRLHILAAVSGGADSVALLALLREAAQTHPLELTVAHFEHGIRAEASLADAAFVRALCEKWGVSLVEGQADVPALARKRSVGLEEAARDARYEFLRQTMKESGADYIALAHHRDDQAETVMMHLLRGSGLHGMAGMKALDGILYRPLLDIPKETLVCYLRERGIEWREDQTNAVPDNPRNALRLKVFPELERIYPGARRAMARFSQIAADEDAYMEAQSLRFEKARVLRMRGMWLIEPEKNGAICSAERALLLRTIHRLTGLHFEAVAKIREMWESREARAVEPGNGWRAEWGSCGLYLIEKGRPSFERAIAGAWDDISLGDGMGRLKIRPGDGVPVTDNPFCQELDASAIAGAVVRTRRSGDVIYPMGAPGRQKLSDYMINKRIDRPLRDAIPLLAKGNEILWVMGWGISEKAKLRENSKAVRLEWTDSPLQMIGGRNDA